MVLASMALFALVPIPAPPQAWPAHSPALPGYLLGIGGVDEALTADMDGDGNQDLVTFSWSASAIRVHLGSGSGSFVHDAVPSTSAPEPLTMRGGATADFDGDGDPDVALLGDVGLEGRLFTWLNDGSGALSLHSATSFLKGGLSLADIDVEGDGWADLVVRRKGSPFLQLVRSLGPAGFATPQPIALPTGYIGMNGFAVGDVDGDGRPDLLTLDYGSLSTPSAAFLHSNDGAGGFHPPIMAFEVTQATNELFLADLRGDGVLHAATFVGDQQQSTLTWLENDGAGSFAARQAFQELSFPATFEHDLCVRDLDGDGREEWVVRVPSGNFGRLVAKGTRVVLSEVELVLPGAGWLTAGDFDSDRAEDLVGKQGGFGSTYETLMLSDGAGGQRGTIVSASAQGISRLALLDFDGDGRLDLAVLDSFANALHLLRGRGDAGFEWIQSMPTTDDPYWIATGDFDGDGRIDLGVGETLVPFIEIFLQDPSGVFAPAGATLPPQVPYAYGVEAIFALDSDADGRDEIAYYDLSMRSVVVVGLDDASTVQVLASIEVPYVARVNGVIEAPPGLPHALELIAPGTSSYQSLWVLAHPFGRTPRKLVERLPLPQPAPLPGWFEPGGPYVDDTDGDGLPEVWSTRFDGEWPHLSVTSVWTGLPGGGFDSPDAGRSPYGLAPLWSGDVDGDGVTDYAYLNGTFDYSGFPYLDRLQLHRPALGQQLARPELYTWTVHAHGDVNGDGRTDLVVIHNGKVVTLLGGAGR